jgi:hypothetical protein
MEMQVVIKLKKAHGEKDSADAVGAEHRNSTKLPNVLQIFCADYIYKADETGLFLCFASCCEQIVEISVPSHNM